MDGLKGRVHLVGAGPGDPGLLTVRAARLLRAADVVIHDALISEAVLDLIPAGVERIDVGKRCGGRRTQQEEINQLLIETASRVRSVVRLKGGDPFIFGRGGEEALALRAAGVPFRVVPGVTAALGAAAYAGIPLTHRKASASVTFVTGHLCTSGESDRIDWARLAQTEDTLAVYMGVGRLGEVADRLIRHGRSPLTPAAVIQWGTYARQRTVEGSLFQIAEKAAEAGIGAPALVVVGQVVALRQQIGWFERRPLHGRKILVARSRPQRSALATRLTSLGADVVEFPRIDIRPSASPEPMRRALENLRDYRWVVLTSPVAVERFWNEARAQGLDARAFACLRFASFGAPTAAALKRIGIRPDLEQPDFATVRGVEAMVAMGDLMNVRILHPRGVGPASALAGRLSRAGALVDEVEAYREVADLDGAAEIRRRLDEGDIDVVALASSGAVRHLSAAVGRGAGRAVGVAIGPETAATAAANGIPIHFTASEPTIRSLVRGIRIHAGTIGAETAHPESGAGAGRPRVAPVG